MLVDEKIDESKTLEIFDPVYTWKTKQFEKFSLREVLSPLFKDGKCVREGKTIQEVTEYTQRELDSLWNQDERIKNPHIYKVDLSEGLWKMKQEMIASKKIK